MVENTKKQTVTSSGSTTIRAIYLIPLKVSIRSGAYTHSYLYFRQTIHSLSSLIRGGQGIFRFPLDTTLVTCVILRRLP